MSHTYGGKDASYFNNQAIGYRFEKGTPLRLDIYNLSSVVGSGNVYSTTQDMNAYIQSIKSNGLINKQSASTMFTPHWQKENFNYGYGWEIADKQDSLWYAHMCNIGNSGYVSSVLFSIDPDVNFIFLTNNDHTIALGVVYKSLEAIVLDQPYVELKKPIETNLSKNEIANYIGTYM